MLHGSSADPVPEDVFFGDDPSLALVHADMGEWLRAHPCRAPDCDEDEDCEC